jgi:O-antigen/teichoic acid export membrane protein
MSANQPGSSWLSFIVKTGRWYLLSSVLSKALALLAIVLLTRTLPPADFGALNAIAALTQALPIFVSLYLDAALARLYHDDSQDPHRRALLFSTLFWFVLCWGSVSVVIFTLLYHHYAAGLTVPLTYLWIATVPTLLLQLTQLGVVFLKQSYEAPIVTKIEIGGGLFGLLGTYLLVVIVGDGIRGRLVALAFASVASAAYVAWHFARARLLVWRFDPRLLKESVAYSLPLLPNLLALWIASTSDRLVIAKYVNLEAVGLYSLAANIAVLLYVVQDAVTQVTGVKVQSGLVSERERTLRMISELSVIMWCAMLFANFCALMFSVQVVELLTGKGYLGASSLIGACGFIYVLSPQNRIFQDILAFHKKTWIISGGALLMAACSLGMNMLLVPRYGYIAAPYVYIGAMTLQTAWSWYWVTRLERLSLQWLRGVLALLIFLLLVVVDQVLLPEEFHGLGVKLLISVTYGLGTAYLLWPGIRMLRKEAM